MRTTTAAQDAALAATERTTWVRVKVEDPDGTFVDVTDFFGEDFLSNAQVEQTVDSPVGTATVTLWRQAGRWSLAPLMEGSEVNRDSSGAYAPFINVNRGITIEVATLQAGEPRPVSASTDWVMIFSGQIDRIDWGQPTVVLRCRDTMAVFNDTIIETVSTYGNDATPVAIETTIQAILDAEFGASTYTLETSSSPGFGIYEYELGNVNVLEALTTLVDLIGWNLHMKWNAANSEFRPYLWEPARSSTTAAYTLSAQDYYNVQQASYDLYGIRNKAEILYTTTAGADATVTDLRTTSQTLYSTRFIRVDARDSSVVTSTQATDLISAVLDDLDEPSVLQTVEAAFLWPIELGDIYEFTANDVHYDTDQTWAVFEYRHVLSPDKCRTVISVSGKASGGFARWHGREEGFSDVPEFQHPHVSVEQSQSGTTGTIALKIDDPQLRVVAVAFEPKAGPTDFDFTTDPSTWAVYDTTRPFTLTDSVTLTAKHNSFIGWAVAHRSRNNRSVDWERGVVSFDLDQIAEITGIEVTFDQSANTIVGVNADEDTANIYFTIAEGSAPADPTAATCDGTIAGRTGYATSTINIGAGRTAFVKAIGYDSASVGGPVASAQFRRESGLADTDGTSRPTSGTGETTLETHTVPGNVLGTSGAVRLTAEFLYSGTNSTKTIRIKWDGTTYMAYSAPSVAPNRAWIDVIVFANASASAQRLALRYTDEGPNIDIDYNAATADTTGDVDLVITGQCANSGDTITLQWSIVEYLAPK